MRQTLYFRHFKPPKPSKPKVLPYHERLMGIGWASMACGCGDIARKSEGFGFILRSFVILNHRPPHQASHHATPDPSGGNAAVVRDKKVMRPGDIVDTPAAGSLFSNSHAIVGNDVCKDLPFIVKRPATRGSSSARAGPCSRRSPPWPAPTLRHLWARRCFSRPG